MHILFDAEVGKWVCIKKLSVDKNTEPIDIATVLFSIEESINKKVWDFLKQEFDLEKVDEYVKELVGPGRTSAKKIEEVLAKINSPSTGKFLKTITPTKKGREILKIYLTRKALELMNFKLVPDKKLLEDYQKEKQLLE